MTLSRNPSQPAAVVALAQQQSDPRLALEIFRAVLDTEQDGFEPVPEGASLWDRPDARPHLEALLGAAASLRRLDRREEAADRLRELLRLDPADHQFARYWLAAILLDLEQHDALKRLFERREERTAVWQYARALFAFRLDGDTDHARQLVQEARGPLPGPRRGPAGSCAFR